MSVQLAWDNIDDFQPRRKKGKNRKQSRQTQQSRNIFDTFGVIEPKTINQTKVFKHFDEGYNLYLHGTAGTGKTFVSLYLALDELYNSRYTNTVTIVRSAVSSRDIGHLPGSKKEKEAEFEAPYSQICQELFGRADAYSILREKGYINFVSTSHIRGITLRDTIVIVDEVQNMNEGELHTIITRVGENSKIIFCGDTKQDDLKYLGKDKSGLRNFSNILSHMESFKKIEFNQDDIVRSGIVKEFILACIKNEHLS